MYNKYMQKIHENWGGVRKRAGRKRDFTKPITISCVLDAAQVEMLDSIASKNGMTRSQVLRKLVELGYFFTNSDFIGKSFKSFFNKS